MPRGGRRPGAGKPKGYKHRRTIEQAREKKLLLEEFRERVRAEFAPLVTAHLEIAKGAFCIFAKTEDGLKRVSDAATIDRLLASGDGYYHIAQQDPDVRALKDLWDRTFGTPAKVLELTGADGGPIRTRVEFVEVDA